MKIVPSAVKPIGFGLLAASALLLAALPAVAQTVTYDVNAGFDPNVNPSASGLYSYGSATGPATAAGTFQLGAFQTYATQLNYNPDNTSPDIKGWGTAQSVIPFVLQNTGTTAETASNFTLQPLQLNLHPYNTNADGTTDAGGTRIYSIVRFIVPTTGDYTLSANFTGIAGDSGGTTTDVHVLVNGTEVTGGSLNGTTPGGAPSVTLTNFDAGILAPGDTISFAVGDGFNGFNSDSTGLTATITTVVPEPSTWAMMAGGLGLLLVGQRFRRTARPV